MSLAIEKLCCCRGWQEYAAGCAGDAADWGHCSWPHNGQWPQYHKSALPQHLHLCAPGLPLAAVEVSIINRSTMSKLQSLIWHQQLQDHHDQEFNEGQQTRVLRLKVRAGGCVCADAERVGNAGHHHQPAAAAVLQRVGQGGAHAGEPAQHGPPQSQEQPGMDSARLSARHETLPELTPGYLCICRTIADCYKTWVASVFCLSSTSSRQGMY